MKHCFFKKAFATFGITLVAGAAAAIAGSSVGARRAATEASETVKFHVDVTGYAPADSAGTRAAVPVNADVYGDYHFVVTMPEADKSTVGADKATVNISMTGVRSLGMKEGETRSYSKTVDTGVSGVSATLSGFLSNVYGFQGATIPVTIKDGASVAKFDYQIGAFANNQIVGTPSDEAKAREAWHLITSNVSASQNLSQNDTHFLFKKGAYILFGDEMLVFDQDYDFLKGEASLSTLFSDVRPYVHVQKSGLSGQAANKAVVYLPEGSTLGISSSAAVLTKDAFLTVDATDKPAQDFTGVLSGLRDQLAQSGDNSTKVAIAFAVLTFNEIVGLVDQAENVPVTLEFKKNKFHVDVTGYSSDNESAVPVAVNADVYGDYSFDVSLPAPGSDNLTANKATVNVRMSDVESLGVEGTRSYSKTIETGVTGVTTTLSSALENTYAFEGATIPVTIKANGETREFTYNIAGIKDYHIVGTPSKVEDARAAWKLMTSQVSASQNLGQNDTHFLFKQGAYVQIGNERLVFDTDYDFFGGASATLDNLFEGIRPAVHVEGVTVDENTPAAVVYLPKGSTLGISSSAATIDKAVTVTVDAEGVDTANINNLLSDYRNAIYRDGEANTKLAIAGLVYYFDHVVGLVDEANTVSVTVDFDSQKMKLYDENNEELSIDSLHITAQPGGTANSRTFVVKGVNLAGSIYAAIEDDVDNAFGLEENIVTEAKPMGGVKLLSPETSKAYTIIYTPVVGKPYSEAKLKVWSEGVDTVIVALHGSLRSVTVKIGGGRLATFCVDFPLDMTEVPEGVNRYGYGKSISELANGSKALDVKSTEAMRSLYLPANAAVLMEGEPGSYTFYEYTPGADGALNSFNAEAYILKGNPGDEPMLVAELMDEYMCGNILTLGYSTSDATKIGFFNFMGEAVPAHRCFIPWREGSGIVTSSKPLTIVFDSETTGISGINSEKDAAQDGAWYNMSGVRFNQKPTQKGLYIHKGKAVVVK